MKWLLIAVAIATLGACGKQVRPPVTKSPTVEQPGAVSEPTTARDAEREVARLTAELAKAKALAGELREQERQEARRRWVLWLTIVSLLGAVGCAVAAWFLPVGRKTLIGVAAGLACVPVLIRALNLVDSAAGWLAPLALIGGASIYLLPQIKKRLSEVKP